LRGEFAQIETGQTRAIQITDATELGRTIQAIQNDESQPLFCKSRRSMGAAE